MAVRVDVGEHVCTDYRVGHVWVLDTETSDAFAIPFQVRGKDHDSLFAKHTPFQVEYRAKGETSNQAMNYSEIKDEKVRTLHNMAVNHYVVGIICHIEFTQFNDARDEFYGRVYVQMSGECAVRAAEMTLLASYRTKLHNAAFMVVSASEAGASSHYRLYTAYLTMFSEAPIS